MSAFTNETLALAAWLSMPDAATCKFNDLSPSYREQLHAEAAGVLIAPGSANTPFELACQAALQGGNTSKPTDPPAKAKAKGK